MAPFRVELVNVRWKDGCVLRIKQPNFRTYPPDLSSYGHCETHGHKYSMTDTCPVARHRDSMGIKYTNGGAATLAFLLDTSFGGK